MPWKIHVSVNVDKSQDKMYRRSRGNEQVPKVSVWFLLIKFSCEGSFKVWIIDNTYIHWEIVLSQATWKDSYRWKTMEVWTMWGKLSVQEQMENTCTKMHRSRANLKQTRRNQEYGPQETWSIQMHFLWSNFQENQQAWKTCTDNASRFEVFLS